MLKKYDVTSAGRLIDLTLQMSENYDNNNNTCNKTFWETPLNLPHMRTIGQSKFSTSAAGILNSGFL
jgi:hypothetical protein